MKWYDVVNKFVEGKPVKGGGKCKYHYNSHYRDVVEVNGCITCYLFHEYTIAKYNKIDKTLYISPCGFPTQTTRDRLDAIIYEFFGNNYRISRVYNNINEKWLMVLEDNKNKKHYTFNWIKFNEKGEIINGELYELIWIRYLGHGRITDFGDYIVAKMPNGIFVVKNGKIYKVLCKKHYTEGVYYLAKEIKDSNINIKEIKQFNIFDFI